jgi:hypothetical protein
LQGYIRVNESTVVNFLKLSLVVEIIDHEKPPPPPTTKNYSAWKASCACFSISAK